MCRLARQALVACLLALYGSVSICGAGLHMLLERSAAHHNHGPIQGPGASISAVSHNCLLCEFQAQVQLPVAVPCQESRPLGVFHVTLAPAFPETSERYATCHPRAPPSSRMRIV